MFRTSALKDFLSLAGCKTSKPGWGSFPQPNTSKCVQQSQNSVHPYDWKGEGQHNGHYALAECANMHEGINGDTFMNLLPEHQTIPECDIPSLQEDFTILLPHLQQHVKQLWHWKAITLWEGHEEYLSMSYFKEAELTSSFWLKLRIMTKIWRFLFASLGWIFNKFAEKRNQLHIIMSQE